MYRVGHPSVRAGPRFFVAEEEGFDSVYYSVGTRWYVLVRYTENARNKQFILDRLSISFW